MLISFPDGVWACVVCALYYCWSVQCLCVWWQVGHQHGRLSELRMVLLSSNRVSAISVEVVTSDERLLGEGLVWLIGAVVCLLAATVGPMSISAGSGWPHLRCNTTGSCQSTSTSEIVKRTVPVSYK